MKGNNYNSREYKLNEVIKGIIVGLFLVLVLSVIVIIRSNDFYYSKEKSSNVEELVTRIVFSGIYFASSL